MKPSHNPMLNPLACCTPIKLTARNSPVISRNSKSSATIDKTQPTPPLGEIAHLQVRGMPWELPQP